MGMYGRTLHTAVHFEASTKIVASNTSNVLHEYGSTLESGVGNFTQHAVHGDQTLCQQTYT